MVSVQIGLGLVLVLCRCCVVADVCFVCGFAIDELRLQRPYRSDLVMTAL